jgi:Short repeat of unknown function (DUF308)
MLALRGAVAILFGILALARPGITALALAILVGAWAVVTGASDIVAGHPLPEGGIAARSCWPWWAWSPCSRESRFSSGPQSGY